MQSHHRHPELRFFNTLRLPACNRSASLVHLHSKPHHQTSTLHRKRLTEDTKKNKRFKHSPCNTPNYESAPPFNFPKCNSASHIPTASTKQTLETPSSKNKQIHTKQAQIEFKITPSKKRRNTEKIRRNRHLLLQLSIAATFFAITNPQRSSSEQSAKPTLLRKRRKRANEERERRTGGGRAGGRAGTGSRRL